MTTPIGIAVVENRGRYLVGFRGEDGPLAGFAEFPGGKCLPGETPRDCALRECREETGLDVAPVRLLLATTFAYPHGTVELHFWLCRPVDVAAVRSEQRGFGWLPTAELAALPFPEANAPVVSMLTGAPD